MAALLFLLCIGLTTHTVCLAYPSIATERSAEQDQQPPSTDSQRDDAVSRKVLGSSVVTSVSVIMDNGSEKLYADAVGKPQTKPSSGAQVASPINLLNPDRYEFYTFSDSGDLVKRLMTLSEIQGIIANADGEAFNQNSHSPEKKVNDVVSNVQNVLKGEMEKGTNHSASSNIVLDTPDVSSSWSVILPAIFGNSGEEIKPAKPQTSMTPDTIMLEHQTPAIVKKPEPFVKITTVEKTTPTTTTGKPTRKPSKPIVETPSTYKPSTYKAPSSTLKPPTTTKKPVKAATSKKTTARPPTPTTAIPKITTRGTRPNRRTTITTTSTTPKPTTASLQLVDESPVLLERVRQTTTSSPTSTPNSANIADASSHFIQLFEPVQTFQAQKVTSVKKPLFDKTTTIRTPPSTTVYTLIDRVGSTAKPLGKVPEGALFIIDEKTNTRIPITTKEQITSLLNKLETTTVKDSFKETNPLPSLNVPLITLNSVNGHQKPAYPDVTDNVALSTNIQSSTHGVDEFDYDRYQQLLLTSTNIYEINKELSKIPTETKSTNKSTIVTTTKPTSSYLTSANGSTTQLIPTILSSTLKEPNLVTLIEQLIQQAINNVQNYEKTTPRSTTTSTTTPLPFTDVPITTTYPSTTDDPTTASLEGFSDDVLFNEAMGSLLSQVASSDFQGLTTLQDLPSTTEVLHKPAYENLEYRIKTTDIFSETTESTTSELPENIDFDPFEKSTEKLDTTEGKLTTVFDFGVGSKTDITDSEVGETTEPDNKVVGTTFGSNNEILKTDATTYDRGGTNTKLIITATDTLDSTTATETLPEMTTEIVKDWPIVYDVGLHDYNGGQNEDRVSTTTAESVKVITTTEKKVIENKEQEQTLEKQSASTTDKPLQEFQNLTFESKEALKINESVTVEKFEDSDSLPSTNSYKEVTSNDALPELDTTTDDDDEDDDSGNKEASTLSIEELIKELTTKGEHRPDVPKETTVLIITKPLYSTSTMSSTNTNTTTAYVTTATNTTISITTTEKPVQVNNTTVAEGESTEAISLDAIASNTDTIDEIQYDFSTVSSSKEPEWTIVSTIGPHNITNVTRVQVNTSHTELKLPQPSRPVDLNPAPQLGGLEETTKHLDQDIYQFVALCNELAFGLWKSVTTGISSARSVVVSPFAATSLLAMVFLGARGATSGEMNEILRLDDMVTFNPHLIFKNVSESIEGAKKDGVAASVILRELYSDKSKGHLLNFYKERAKAFYDGHVEEVSFKDIGDVIRRRTNLIVKKQTDGKVSEYIKDGSISVKSPLAGVSASIFHTDCSDASVEGRDGELYFVVLPSIRQRRLVPIPAAVWRGNFLAGYDPTLDATAVALSGGRQHPVVSTIFVIPGQQGIGAPGDGLARLERSLVGGAFRDKAWSRLLRTLIPRPGLELQLPRFQHRSVINATVALQQMGMRDLFDAAKADLRGLNGVANDLYLSDIVQLNCFATCGEAPVGDAHHAEIYPATAKRAHRTRGSRTFLLPPYDADLSEEPRDYQRAFHDPLHDPSLYTLPLPLRPRQARLPDPPRLRFDRPFLYFVRHNPTGLILHMGRFNPRLLP